MAVSARIATLILPLAVACGPKGSTEAVPSAASTHPDLQCPPGTWSAGEGPPAGVEVWCELRSPSEAVRQGPSIHWYENGRRRSEGGWVAGKPHGEWRHWHPNGTPQARGTLAHGLREGVWTTYHPDGTRESEGNYVGGKQHGPWIFWDDEALTRTEGLFELGDRSGRWVDVDPGGVEIRERVYRNGRLVNQRELGG